MKVYEFQAKTVEKAIKQGLEELKKSQFDVDIKILESGGLFKKAKIQIIVEDEEELKTEEKPSKMEEVKEQPKQIVEEKKEVEKQPKQEKAEKVVVQNPVENVVEEKIEKPVETKIIEEISKEKVEKEVLSSVDEKEKPKRQYANNKGTKEFLSGLLNAMEIEGEVVIEEQEEHTKAMISCQETGILIGHRGEALAAIQYLTNTIEQKNNRYAKRVIVDAGDYRDKRDDNLKDLADRLARKVLKFKKAEKLRPMNAYDRRIVHTYLQNFEGVTTHSVGKEPNRCLIIDVKRDI